MRKFFYLCIITCFLLFVSSCETTNKLVSELTIISVNDFHGALDESDGKYGVARLASSISAEEKNAEASVLILSLIHISTGFAKWRNKKTYK